MIPFWWAADTASATAIAIFSTSSRARPLFGITSESARAFDQFHREERHAVDGLDRMNRDDVRMVERGYGSSLALETLAPFGIDAGRRVRQHLERDEPVEP